MRYHTMTEQNTKLRKLVLYFVIGLYLLGVLWGLTTNLKRSQALKFQSIDYAMYMQFSTQLADPALSDRLTANPVGYNIFGLEEIEAKASLHQAIHFEPVKYLYVPLYALFHGPSGIYLFISLLYYTPLLYFYRIHPKDKRDDLLVIVAFALLYACMAASINSLGFDARPRILMTPALLLLTFAVHYRRPLWEKLLALVMLFAVREEAVLLAPVVIAYGFLRQDDKGKRIRWALSAGGLWLLYAAVLAVYYRWTGYQNYDEYSSLDFFRHAPWFLYPVLALIILYVFYFLYTWLKKNTLFTEWPLALATYAFILLFAAARFTQGLLGRQLVAPGKSLPDVWLDSLRNPDSSLLLVALLAMLVMLWNYLDRQPAKQTLLLALSLLTVVTLIDGAGVLLKHVQTWQQRIPPAQLVFEQRQASDPYSSGILTDEETFQAFYDYENVVMYQRLPWSLYGADRPRYYPQNVDQLGPIVKQGIDYIVVNKTHDGDINDILESQSIPYTIHAGNESYTIYKLETVTD